MVAEAEKQHHIEALWTVRQLAEFLNVSRSCVSVVGVRYDPVCPYRSSVAVPDHVDHRFRGKPITDSGRSRSLNG